MLPSSGFAVGQGNKCYLGVWSRLDVGVWSRLDVVISCAIVGYLTSMFRRMTCVCSRGNMPKRQAKWATNRKYVPGTFVPVFKPGTQWRVFFLCVCTPSVYVIGYVELLRTLLPFWSCRVGANSTFVLEAVGLSDGGCDLRPVRALLSARLHNIVFSGISYILRD